MRYPNETLFLVFALLQFGLLISSLPFLQKEKFVKPNYDWLVALGLNTFAYLLFVITSSTFPQVLTFANTCYVGGYFFIYLFSRSLNGHSNNRIVSLSPGILIIYGCCFEYIRQFGTFGGRASLALGTLIICLILILSELFSARKKERYIQLDFLILTSIVEMVLAVIRVYLIVTGPSLGKINLYEEPFSSALWRWIGVAFTTLSFISIIGYLAEKLSRENSKNTDDNIRYKALIHERETLIANLVKANRTAATGALSASIAHELNQPLGASTLNIQFLRMKLEKGLLSPKLGGEILDSLEADNKRAATIVKSLRSIFADDDSYAQRVEVELLISNVLSVVNPHLKSRNIQMQLKVQEGLQILVSPSEIEQVILNLINNSIQSLDSSKIAKGVIALVAKQDGRYVNISISDNGSGVPEEFKQHLFELLNTTKQSGMGLGLWLCRHLLTRLGGTIWYENAKGGGAKFNFKIPLAP